MAKAEPPYQNVIEEVEHGRTGRRLAPSDVAIRVTGITLVSIAILLIVAAPEIMSRWMLTSWQLFCLAAGIAFGLFTASHARHRQMVIERAYSGHLEELSQRLRNMAYRDAVTGLYNHRYFREQLGHEIDRALRYNHPLSLIMMDMNGFKGINDRYGHFTGDRFLGLVGEVIGRHIRASDIGARYGGDEFVVVLPSTTYDEAMSTAEKLADAVASCASMTTTGEPVQLGLSFGVATCPEDSRAAGELIERADARLYEAKAARKTAPRVA